MGSQSDTNLAYISGFLDGDGSLMLQLKKRNDGSRKWRFMCTICFYQDSRHKNPLSWIKQTLEVGYLSDRNDGMTELRINGFKQIRLILEKLIPYIKFKEVQAKALYEACILLEQSHVAKKDLMKLANLLVKIQSANYSTRKKKSLEEIYKLLDLTP